MDIKDDVPEGFEKVDAYWNGRLLVVLGIPLWILIIIKLIGMVIILNYFIKYHHKRNIYVRYIMISILLNTQSPW